MIVSSICDEITSQEHDDHHILFDYLFQRLPFADLENEFVEIIKTKAKFTNLNELFSSQSEKQQINYYKLLHSFFIFRGDFRNGKFFATDLHGEYTHFFTSCIFNAFIL
jgi:hypothetical protein